MAEHSRIDDLRRRVQKDPASIAFAQLAEELRRSGGHQEAVDTCRAGLKIHPGYLSARVTLGRALIELGHLDEAQVELARVLESAPENLAAIRGLAEIHHRRGDLVQALAQYRAALLLARNDPDLEETIDDLSRQVEPTKPALPGGLTLEHMQDELLKLAPPPAKPDRGVRLQADNPAKAGSHETSSHETSPPEASSRETSSHQAGSQETAPTPEQPPQSPPSTQRTVSSAISADSAVNVAAPPSGTLTASADDRAARTVTALEQWLAAIHVSREDRHP